MSALLADREIAPEPESVAAAPAMGDILPPVKKRRGILGFAFRHPTIALGGLLLLVMLFMAVAAPLLATVDPTALVDPAVLRSANQLLHSV